MFSYNSGFNLTLNYEGNQLYCHLEKKMFAFGYLLTKVKRNINKLRAS